MSVEYPNICLATKAHLHQTTFQSIQDFAKCIFFFFFFGVCDCCSPKCIYFWLHFAENYLNWNFRTVRSFAVMFVGQWDLLAVITFDARQLMKPSTECELWWCHTTHFGPTLLKILLTSPVKIRQPLLMMQSLPDFCVHFCDRKNVSICHWILSYYFSFVKSNTQLQLVRYSDFRHALHVVLKSSLTCLRLYWIGHISQNINKSAI